MPRPRSRLLRVLVVLSVLWLGFVLTLDIMHGMFPRVLIGGTKILVAGLLAIGLLVAARRLGWSLLRYLLPRR